MSKTQELIQKLNDGVQELFTSDRYAEYLRFMASFHSYSASNCYLIFSQMPNATLCCSYGDWKKKNRIVRRGQKGIAILAPHSYTIEEDGELVTKLGFHQTYTYDISQTYGEDVPALCLPLDTDVNRYQDLKELLLSVSPCPVDILDIEGAANGYFSPSACRIAVQKDMSEASTIKTILHEQSHAWTFANMPEEKYNRREHEVIAESCAYIVSQWLGIDTSDYSFGYVAGWSSDKSLPELRNCLDIIRKISELMISHIEEALADSYEITTAVA